MPRRRHALIVSASLAFVAASGAARASVGAATTPQGGVVVLGAASEAGTSVPEPGSITLISAGLALLLATTRRFMG